MPSEPGFLRNARKGALVSLPPLLAFLIAGSLAHLTRASVQEKEVKNPFAGNAAAIKEGESLFRVGCAFCHGLGARGGGRAPDLTSGRWVHGDRDAAIFRTITQGVPGTLMPANDLPDSETWMIIAYLRSLAASARRPITGNREEGEKIFFGKGICSQCHMVRGRGSRLGPDLSRVGASRSTQYLIDSIREPSKELTEGLMEPNNPMGFPVAYETVSIVTKNGQRITGVPKNEDTFTLQLMDTGEQLHLFLKKDLQEVIHERQSLMPEYNERMLSDKELQDLLAYLDSLRGL